MARKTCFDCDEGPCYMNCGPAIRLPDGWDWDRVRRERIKWGISDDFMPVASAPGVVVAWATINSIRSL